MKPAFRQMVDRLSVSVIAMAVLFGQIAILSNTGGIDVVESSVVETLFLLSGPAIFLYVTLPMYWACWDNRERFLSKTYLATASIGYGIVFVEMAMVML